MLNLQTMIESKKKLVIFLLLITIALATLGISLIPSFDYRTGENLSQQEEFSLDGFILAFYFLFIGIITVMIFLLTFVSKKLYIVKRIDESIDGIKKGKILSGNTVPRRNELLQSHFAEKIKETGIETVSLKIFDGITQAEKDEIMGFNIDEKPKEPIKNFSKMHASE